MFPRIQGSNLQGRAFHLPADFEGRLNVVMIAFTEPQQYEVYTWVDFLARLRSETPDLAVYELPTVPAFSVFQRMMLDYWMRAGIPDPHTRATTITLYTDQAAFARALNLPTMRTMHTLLVDRMGTVYWHAAGAFTPQKGAQLSEQVRALQEENIR